MLHKERLNKIWMFPDGHISTHRTVTLHFVALVSLRILMFLEGIFPRIAP